MLLVLSNDNNSEPPKGYKKLSDTAIIESYLKMDRNNSYQITKNEWMLYHIKLLEKDFETIEKQGPDAFMQLLQELSDEFDRYDTNGNKILEYQEYKALISNNFYISED